MSSSKSKLDFHKQKNSNVWTTPRLKTLLGQFRQLEEKLGSWLELEENYSNSSDTLQIMHEFVVNRDLKLIRELLPDSGQNREEASVLVLENLQPFFTAGFLLDFKVSLSPRLSRLFYRGVLFPLPDEGLPYAKVLPKISPLEVKVMDARKWLRQSPHLDFLKVDLDSQAFLIQPLPQISYILISEVPRLWREEHMKDAHRLINNSFDQFGRRAPSL